MNGSSEQINVAAEVDDADTNDAEEETPAADAKDSMPDQASI